jgi:HTH-type transcriptional regulator / antitoxin HigA
MKTLPYTVIRNSRQYDKYCKELEGLLMQKSITSLQQDIIDLLTLLIEKWDADHNTMEGVDPVELLKYLMTENTLKANELALNLGISKSLMSDILNYRRGLSKENIRKLADHFKLSQEAFNRPYKLIARKKLQAHKKHIASRNRSKAA